MGVNGVVADCGEANTEAGIKIRSSITPVKIRNLDFILYSPLLSEIMEQQINYVPDFEMYLLPKGELPICGYTTEHPGVSLLKID